MFTVEAENATENFVIDFFSRKVQSKYILWIAHND
jgi:hypothetical protein